MEILVGTLGWDRLPILLRYKVGESLISTRVSWVEVNGVGGTPNQIRAYYSPSARNTINCLWNE